MNIYHDHETQKACQQFVVYLTDGLLYDKLHMLAAEYTISVERLATLAVKRLIEDVEMVRKLRADKAGGI